MSIPLFPRYRHLCVLFLLLAINSRLPAQCLTNFIYSAPITITNPGDSTLLDYQMTLTINTAALVAAGKLRADGADLRFIDGSDCCAPLPLYIESGMNSAATAVWVRVPRIPAHGSRGISMVYGSGSARSASDAAGVFALYDDFLGNDLDGTKWKTNDILLGSGTIKLGSSRAHFTTGSDSAGGMAMITSQNSFATPVIVEMMVVEASGAMPHLAQHIAGTGNGYGLCLQDRLMLFGFFTDPWRPAGNVPYDIPGFLSATPAGEIAGVWSISWSRITDEAIGWPGGVLKNTEQTYTQIPIGPRVVVSLGVFRDIYSFERVDGMLSADWVRVRRYAETLPIASAPGLERVAIPPTILRAPASRMVCPGESATFEVMASGTSGFQWRKEGRPIDGATGSSFTVTAATPADTGGYDVVIMGNGCGAVAVAGPAQLAFHVPLRMEITDPETRTLCAGNSVHMGVRAEGAIAYQWRKNGAPIDAAVGRELTIPSPTAADDGIYDVLVSGGCGASAISAPTTLRVIDQPRIIEGPRDTTVCREGRFTLSATVTGPGLRYQWRRNGRAIEGATSVSYTRSAQPWDQGVYDVVVRGTCGPAISSAPARVTVLAEPLITAQPLSLSVAAGEPATFRVTAEGGGNISYQWQKDGTDIPGATLPHYTIARVSRDNIGAYNVVVTGTLCRESAPAVVSQAAELTLEGAPAIVAGPDDQHVCAGGAALFTVSAVGSGLRYQWRRDGVPIAGATERRYAIATTTISDAGSYDVVVTSPSGETLRSDGAILSVAAPASITRQPTGKDICAGESVELAVVASGDGLRYQWRRGGIAIPSATTTSHTIAAAAQSDQGEYDVLVMGSCDDTIASRTATITVGQAATILREPVTIRAREGEEATFSVDAAGDEIRYAWERDGVIIPGATAPRYTIERISAMDTGSYRAIVTGACPPGDTSAVALLIIDGTSAVPGTPESIEGPSLTVLPHPASGMTQLLVRLPDDIRPKEGARLMLYDAMGIERADLSESFARGRFMGAEFDAGTLPSGPYYCRIIAGRWQENIGVVIVTR